MKGLSEKLAEIWANLLAELASLRGRKFGILIAASIVATSVIVSVAITGTKDSNALAGLLGKGLGAAGIVAPVDEPAAEEGAATEGGGVASLPPPAEDKVVTTAAQPTVSSTPTATDTTPDDTDETPDDSDETPDDTDETPEDPDPEAGRIKNVFVINLSSPGYEQIWGDESQMPYLAETLRPKGELLTNYTLLDDGPMANNIATISGQPPNPLTVAGCTSYKQFSSTAASRMDEAGRIPGAGCVYPPEVFTMPDQFTLENYAWHAYVEDMTNQFGAGNCVKPNPDEITTPLTGGYQVQRNPFIYFRSLIDLGDCAENDVQFDELAKDLKKPASTPNYSFISPNLCHVGVPGQCPEGAPDGPAAADAFIEEQVPLIMKSPAYKEAGLIMVTFNEVRPPDGATDPLRVGALLLSPFISTNVTLGTGLDPYSMLRTVQDLFGLDHLASARVAGTKSIAGPLLGTNSGD